MVWQVLSRMEALETKREGIFVMPKVRAHYNMCMCMCTACAPHVHRMCTACACALHVHCMCTACALHVHCMCTACALHGPCMFIASLACPKERIEVLSTSVMTSYMGQLVVEPPDAAERARALDVRAGDAAACRKQCESACEKEL